MIKYWPVVIEHNLGVYLIVVRLQLLLIFSSPSITSRKLHCSLETQGSFSRRNRLWCRDLKALWTWSVGRAVISLSLIPIFFLTLFDLLVWISLHDWRWYEYWRICSKSSTRKRQRVISISSGSRKRDNNEDLMILYLNHGETFLDKTVTTDDHENLLYAQQLYLHWSQNSKKF
jgi:hypothetical protein